MEGLWGTRLLARDRITSLDDDVGRTLALKRVIAELSHEQSLLFEGRGGALGAPLTQTLRAVA